MIINGQELEDIDIFDLETMEKCENALDKVVEEAQKLDITKGMKHSEIIKKQCIAVFDCFNEIFGEGTDKKIFGDKTNLKVCLSAFEELVKEMNKQKKEFETLANKYSSNRAQRRTKK